jgi:hypothetical protein
MIWHVPRIWEGGDVWIIGGGPSVPKQFNIPDKVVQEVVSGVSLPSIYSPYMSYLHDKHVIGINVAYLIGNWIDIVFFGDASFFLPHQQRLALFPGMKISCHAGVNKHNWIKYLPKQNEKKFGISTTPKMVCWNGNSGAAAISVAVHAGAKRIILLGFDMSLNNNRQHWHDLYHRGNKSDPKKLPFSRHLKGFPDINKDAGKMGITILNCSPESKIEVFKKVTLKELINERN